MDNPGNLEEASEDLRTHACDGDASDVVTNCDMLDTCGKKVADHLREVVRDVEAAIEEEARKADEECASMKTTIEQEAEREMESIRARRDQKLKENRLRTVERQQTIADRKRELLRQIHSLGQDIRGTLEKVKTRHYGSPAAKLHANIDKLLASSENREGTESPKNGNSVASGLQTVASQVSTIAANVAFVRVKGSSVGRIDGAKDRWVLEEEIDVAPVQVPVLKGAISENEVVIEDIKTSLVYVTNILDKTTKLALEDKLHLFNCAAKDHTSPIVCGTREGCVMLYDRSWKLIRRVTLPEKLHQNETMCVAVGPGGVIYIATYGSGHIHVYHPSGSRWLTTIEVGDMVPIHGVHNLPSGIAVHSAMYGEQVCVLNDDGTPKATAYLEESEEKCLSVLAANSHTGSLYNLSCSSSSGRCVVEELLNVSSGDVVVRKLVEFPAPRMANGLIGAQGFSAVQSDKIVACDGNQILVLSKRQGVDSLTKIVP